MALSFEDEQHVRDILREELQIFAGKQIFAQQLQLLEGRNIQTGTDIGTQIATAANQKVGFHGVSPVAQQSDPGNISLTDVSGTGDDATINSNNSTIQSVVNDMLGIKRSYGFID